MVGGRPLSEKTLILPVDGINLLSLSILPFSKFPIRTTLRTGIRFIVRNRITLIPIQNWWITIFLPRLHICCDSSRIINAWCVRPCACEVRIGRFLPNGLDTSGRGKKLPSDIGIVFCGCETEVALLELPIHENMLDIPNVRM